MNDAVADNGAKDIVCLIEKVGVDDYNSVWLLFTPLQQSTRIAGTVNRAKTKVLLINTHDDQLGEVVAIGTQDAPRKSVSDLLPVRNRRWCRHPGG